MPARRLALGDTITEMMCASPMLVHETAALVSCLDQLIRLHMLPWSHSAVEFSILVNLIVVNYKKFEMGKWLKVL